MALWGNEELGVWGNENLEVQRDETIYTLKTNHTYLPENT